MPINIAATRSHARGFFSGLALIAMVGAAVPAFAQSNEDEVRIRKLEAEVRALQRKVFPGGDGRFFEPQITGSTAAPANTNPVSTTAVTDILVRLDALESQIASLTSQTEENANALSQLSARMFVLETSSSNTNDGGTMADGNDGEEAFLDPIVPVTSATPAPRLPTPRATPRASEPTGPSAARLAAVREIAKPQTDDAADDEYSYGFRLWEAGLFPEAQQQLTMFVEEYPNHPRATYGRNLLGRAYLDAGQPNDAAPWFLKNYQADKQDARAPDSLLYLAETMIAIKDTSRACIALAEFSESYPAIASGRLSDQYQRNVGRVTCN